MKRERISAVVPTFNSEKTIRPCLESLIANGVDEIIVVDGASSDRTLELVSSYSGVKVFRGVEGVGAAKDLGWRKAGGELIVFLDSDAYIQPGTVQRLGEHLAPEQVAGVACRVACANVEKYWARMRDFDFQLHYAMLFKTSKVADCDSDPTICGLFKRRALEAIGGVDESFPWAEDLDLLRRLTDHGYRVLMVYEPTVMHFHRDVLLSLLTQIFYHGFGRGLYVRKWGGSFRGSPGRVLSQLLADFRRSPLFVACYLPYRILMESAFLFGYVVAVL